MLTIIKRLVFSIIVLGLIATAVIYGALTLSLPSLDGTGKTSAIKQAVNIERDTLGQAVITASSQSDAAYGLGFAHGQDRFFQMDLLRRNAAGELSELFGKGALTLDKKMRFHQLRKRSEAILAQLPQAQKNLLHAYSQGVNDALAQQQVRSFEYLLTQTTPKPWQETDSLLVMFSMYLDLQSGTFERDMTLEQIERKFGVAMRKFITQPSQYQAALDGSEIPLQNMEIPELTPDELSFAEQTPIADPQKTGSNNWAVSATHSTSGKAMISDDMHLGFGVPIIWYRAQLRYGDVKVTGVTLPGAPAVVVGSNGHIAWGFTNGYIDTSDWIALQPSTKTHTEAETIAIAGEPAHQYKITMSDYGPVRTVDGKRYALAWVGHQAYALNLNLTQLHNSKTVQQALTVASTAGMPVQNLVVVDSQGQAAWQLMGAIAARTNPSDVAVAQKYYQTLWQQNQPQRPQVINPENGRIWTANSRVLSADDNTRFGNGGYALGARAQQIRDRLFEKEQFNEQDFLKLQLDNQARFLVPWRNLLLDTLKKDPLKYAQDIDAVHDWQECACPDSVGYTLVRRFRSEVINHYFSPLQAHLRFLGLSLSAISSSLEPAIWQLIKAPNGAWGVSNSQQALLNSYQRVQQKLSKKYGENMSAWRWGKVNELHIQHPFAKQMPLLAKLLNMPKSEGMGDSYMPAVQRPEFGASQRFIAQPANEKDAIMMIPGGQSAHPLSPFYRKGYQQYINNEPTPLLPQQVIHQILIEPSSNDA